MKPCYLEPDFWTLKTVSVDLRQKQKDIIQVLKKKKYFSPPANLTKEGPGA